MFNQRFNWRYVLSNYMSSDKPGNHNFDLLRKLVLPDGSVLRAKLPGRPTRDCLFADPARDGIRFACFLTNSSLLYFPLLSLSA